MSFWAKNLSTPTLHKFERKEYFCGAHVSVSFHCHIPLFQTNETLSFSQLFHPLHFLFLETNTLLEFLSVDCQFNTLILFCLNVLFSDTLFIYFQPFIAFSHFFMFLTRFPFFLIIFTSLLSKCIITYYSN